MIALAPIDYVILVTVLVVIFIKLSADFREVKAAKAVKKGLALAAEKRFSPKLTVIIPLHSLSDTKDTIKHFAELDFPTELVIVLDSLLLKERGALRYFLKKNNYKKVRVVSKKQPNVAEFAKAAARSGLVVVLPDTARLNASFYREAIIPFGDPRLGAVMLTSSVRPDETLASGIEVLFTSWREYVGSRRNPVGQIVHSELLEGVVIRAKYSHHLPKIERSSIDTRKATYSVAAQGKLRLSWSKLQDSVSLIDVFSLLYMTIIAVASIQLTHNLVLSSSIFILLYVMMVWWSFVAMRITFFDRLILLLLSPVFLIIGWGLVFSQSLRVIFRPLYTIKSEHKA